MALMKQDMKPVLQKYAGFGYTIYYLLQEHKISFEDIENVFLKLNPDIAFLYLEKILHKITVDDFNKGYLSMSSAYTKEDCALEYFGDSNKTELSDDFYQTALNYHYTSQVLEQIRNNHGDKTASKIITTYQSILAELKLETKDTLEKSTLNRR